MTAPAAPAATPVPGPTTAPAPVGRNRRPRTLRSRRRRDALLGYLLVSPSLVVFGAFVVYPFAKNIWLGLYRTPPFPGLPKSPMRQSRYRWHHRSKLESQQPNSYLQPRWSYHATPYTAWHWHQQSKLILQSSLW